MTNKLVSILVKNALILTADAGDTIVKNGGIFIEGKTITDVGPSKKLEKEHQGDIVIDAAGKIAMPGMVSCHTHMYGIITHGMPLQAFHGVKRSFISSLEEVWWPYVEDQLTQKEIYAASLGCSMMLAKNGVTCISDILEAPNTLPGALEKEAEAIKKVGLRGILSVEASERISEENAKLATKENVDFIRKWNRKDALVKGKLCTHTTFSCSERFLREVRALADENEGGIQIHLEESPDETMFSKNKFKKLPVRFYDEIGFLGPDVLAAQCCYTKDEEIDILKKRGVKISHQPMSNSGLGSIAPVPKFLAADLTVGLGAEHYLDLFESMRFAFLLHKACLHNQLAMKAENVFKMATINGGRAVGYEKSIGSIEPNKKADIIIISMEPLAPLRPENVIGQLVEKANGKCVDSVIIDGKLIMENRKMLTVREDEIQKLCLETASSFWEKVNQLKDLPTYRCH